MSSSDDQAEQIAALETKVQALQEELKQIRAEQRTLAEYHLYVAKDLTANIRPDIERLDQAYDRIHIALLELRDIRTKIDRLDHLFGGLLKGRAMDVPTATLLEFYIELIEPTGKSLIDWLREINASERYRAVVALRSRRQRGNNRDNL